MRQLLRRLLVVGPHAGAHRVAVRACISILVPLLVLLALDRLEWSIYATFGAFTSLYGRERTAGARLTLQLEAAVLQTAMVTLGVLVGMSDERSWLSVPIAAVVALGASYLSTVRRWHPPGSLFQVFGFAAVASAPSTRSDLMPAVVVAGLTALFAVAVGSAGPALRRRFRPGSSSRPIGGAREGVLRYALQSGIGVLVAGTLATSAGIGRPYWAMVSAVVPLVASDLTVQVVRGLHRVVGTVLGLLLAALVFALDLHGLAVVLVVVLLQGGAELLVGRNYALALVFVTPLALLMVHLVAPVPTGELLVDRGVETVIGVVIGVAVGYLSRPHGLRLRRA